MAANSLRALSELLDVEENDVVDAVKSLMDYAAYNDVVIAFSDKSEANERARTNNIVEALLMDLHALKSMVNPGDAALVDAVIDRAKTHIG